MPLIATRGAASAQGFGEFSQQAPANYIEDVFSTWLYPGNGSTQTITNGIDLSTKGGLVWIKARTSAVYGHRWVNTNQGAGISLSSSNQNGSASEPSGLTSFSTTGFTVSSDTDYNASGDTYVSWTLRKQPKFFDMVSYTGNGSAGRTISHSLGSTPGCIIVKRTDNSGIWAVYHTSLGNTQYIDLSQSTQAFTDSTYWNNTSPTSTNFTVGTNNAVNVNGATYIAFLFAHNAGGFGLSGSDNVISCGTFTTDGTGKATVTLGYEPQWIIAKRTNSAGDWYMTDVMRGMPVGSPTSILTANINNAEYSSVNFFSPTATGFLGSSLDSSAPFIYIAIRRGPMKVPTSGTSVYSGVLRNGTNTAGSVTSPNFAPDAIFSKAWGNTVKWAVNDKLRGVASTTRWLYTNTTDAEEALSSSGISAYTNTGYTLAADSQFLFNASGYTNYVDNVLLRAPGFFDEVCITGPTTSVSHNLGVAPEICIFKRRNGISNWPVQLPSRYLFLNSDTGNLGAPFVTNFGATTLTVDPGSFSSGETWVGYLFATCPGVSKVGSYTGTGALQTINCGFTGGARFVLIKRTDSTGDWYVYNSARGISSGNDPYVFLNSNAAEVTGTNYVDTTSVGFQVTAAAPAGLNANGGTYIFLAIA